ncbi:hypothetical protein H0N96_02530, partial [Candidatus Micrarchaeota archaeon]|nr:hypothetical protein [Candidatus Micrarchaeota archaeon]
LVKADSECFSEGRVKVLELGQCVQSDNGYKLVLSDISGFPNNPLQLQAVFKLFDSGGGLIETIMLSPCTAQFCGAYYTTQHGLSIDLISAFSGIGQIAYADVYVRSWTQYKEFMPLGGEASFPGLRIELSDVSGSPTSGSYFPPATFKAYDSQGNLVKQFVLQRGWAGQTQVVEDVTNGVLTHLLIAFAGIGQTAYANVGFKTVSATPTPIPCSNDVYAFCADGFKYLKSHCVNGVLIEVQYSTDPCLMHGAMPTVRPSATPPAPPEKETFTLNLKKGWNMLSTPISDGAPPCTGVCRAMLWPGAMITSTTCSPAKLWYYENGGYQNYGMLADGGWVHTGGFWVKVAEDCKVELSASRKNFGQVSLQTGWNQIGAFYEPTAFKNVQGACVVLSGPWHYNAFTKNYEKASVLQPGEGYFVKVASNCILNETTSG